MGMLTTCVRCDVNSRRQERRRRHVGDQYLRSFWTELVQQRDGSGSRSVPRQLCSSRERTTSSQCHVQQRKHSWSVNVCILPRLGDVFVFVSYRLWYYCHAMQCISAAYDVVRCLIVHPSVTFVDSVENNKHIVKIISPSGSHTILVLPYKTLWQYSHGDPLTGTWECRWLGTNCDSLPICGYRIDDCWSASNNCNGPPHRVVYRTDGDASVNLVYHSLQHGRPRLRETCLHVCLCVNAGNPFMFMVIDPLKVSVRGDGLGLIKANQSTSFVITAPAADLSDLDVTVTGVFLYLCLSISPFCMFLCMCVYLCLWVCEINPLEKGRHCKVHHHKKAS